MNTLIRSRDRLRARRRSREGGFTLIELLVVITILGILAAIVVFSVQGVGDKGKSAAISTDAKTLQTAEEAYCAKNGHYADVGTLNTAGFLASTNDTYNVVDLGDSGKCGTGPDSSYVVSDVSTTTQTAGASITVGTNPQDLAVDSALNKVYVLNVGSSSVSVIDAISNTVTKTIPITPAVTWLDRITVDAKDNLVYVTTGSDQNAVAINETTDTLLGPLATATNPDAPGDTLYPGGFIAAQLGGPVVVDSSTGNAYAWARDATLNRDYLLQYGANPTTTAPTVINVNSGSETWGFVSGIEASEVAATVIDPGRALYQIGQIGGIRYWLAVDLTSGHNDAVTLTPFPASGADGRNFQNPLLSASTMAGVNTTTHVAWSVIDYDDACNGQSAGVVTLAGATTAAPVLDDKTQVCIDPSNGGQPDDYAYQWFLTGSPVAMDPFSHNLLIWGLPDTGNVAGDTSPQDQVSVVGLSGSSFTRLGRTGTTIGYFQHSASPRPVVLAKSMVVNPNTDRVYLAPSVLTSPAVGLGGVTSFLAGSPVPTSVDTGTRFAALAIDTTTNTVYATDYTDGTVAVIK